VIHGEEGALIHLTEDGDGKHFVNGFPLKQRDIQTMCGTLLLYYSYTVVTRLLHCCYTVVTLLLHCCYTVVTLLLYCCYTVVTLLLYCSHPVVILLSSCCYTCCHPVVILVVTLLLHCCHPGFPLLTRDIQTMYVTATRLPPPPPSLPASPPSSPPHLTQFYPRLSSPPSNTRNGVIHVLDEVLLPPRSDTYTVAQVMTFPVCVYVCVCACVCMCMSASLCVSLCACMCGVVVTTFPHTRAPALLSLLFL
jgi:hypothetical protein